MAGGLPRSSAASTLAGTLGRLLPLDGRFLSASRGPVPPGALSRTQMYRVHETELPGRGRSRGFVGADHGDVAVSAYFVHMQPGEGPGPHRHPYDEVALVQAGRAEWTVEGETFEVGTGEILMVKAGEVHGFRCVGEGPLVQLDLHLTPRFIQEDL